MSEAISSPPREIWRIRTVCSKINSGKSTVYYLIQHAGFPRPKKIGARASGWDSLEVQAWIDARLSGGAA